MKQFAVYILASSNNGTLYVGSTSDLMGRVWKHREKYYEKSFTSKYGVSRLVYYELCDDGEAMTSRERTLKAYKRQWKINLIKSINPGWDDLYAKLSGL
jgi:putative endonuclease